MSPVVDFFVGNAHVIPAAIILFPMAVGTLLAYLAMTFAKKWTNWRPIAFSLLHGAVLIGTSSYILFLIGFFSVRGIYTIQAILGKIWLGLIFTLPIIFVAWPITFIYIVRSEKFNSVFSICLIYTFVLMAIGSEYLGLTTMLSAR